MQASATTEDLFNAGRTAWRLTLVGSPAPWVAAMRDRMMKPRRGDVVIEISTFATAVDPDRVGIFVRQQGGDYVIRPYDQQDIEQTWRNAEFVAVPCRGEGWPS